MSDPIGPVGKVERRTGDRRDDERRAGQPRAPRALVPAGPLIDVEPEPGARGPATTAAPAPDVSPTVFAAQILGQTGARKGLRGGPPVLDAARSTYLGNEYAGAKDRRPKPGKSTKTEL